MKERIIILCLALLLVGCNVTVVGSGFEAEWSDGQQVVRTRMETVQVVIPVHRVGWPVPRGHNTSFEILMQ